MADPEALRRLTMVGVTERLEQFERFKPFESFKSFKLTAFVFT